MLVLALILAAVPVLVPRRVLVILLVALLVRKHQFLLGICDAFLLAMVLHLLLLLLRFTYNIIQCPSGALPTALSI